MQSRTVLIVALCALSAGCYLFFGPPRSRIRGLVYSVEQQAPLPRAEICALGLDTICVRADGKGRYSLSLPEQTIVLRFRFGALTPAASDSIRLLPPAPVTVNCALSSRLVLSERPVPCQPVPGQGS
jgi:hypothetical protein